MKIIQRTLPENLSHLKDAPLPDRLFAARGAINAAPTALSNLLPARTMSGIHEAATLLARTLDAKGHIVVIADYDADGATACAIAVRGLRLFGADVSYIVPNRFTDGYGLSPALVERALARRPALIVTVDNGISAIAGVAAAVKHGVPVLVTDHHLAGPELPDAAVIVNPNQPGCGFASKNLAGCGVMFYVLAALHHHFRSKSDPRAKVSLSGLLDLLALGTVADVVSLDANNRILVGAGLARIRAGLASPGIRQLFLVAGCGSELAGAQDLGFMIGPRINAAGRMDDASVGIECLIEEDVGRAAALALELHETNQARKSVQADIESQAQAIAEQVAVSDRYSIVAYEANWHEGVIGIVAGRLKEQYRRPTIVFARTEEGHLKGSGRSIPSFHLRDALARVEQAVPDAIVRFGGHAMAAGLTVRAERFQAFIDAFEDQAKALLRPEDLEEVVVHDGALRAQDLTIENAKFVKTGIWGQGFPAPLFEVDARVASRRILKDKHTKFLLDIGGKKVDAILFNQVVESGDRLHAIAKLDLNEWNGRESVQLMLSHPNP